MRRLCNPIGHASLAALAASLCWAPAHAQQAGANEADVIIVTAQRREQALEDVPMSVTVLSSETLDAAGVTNVRDLATVTTGYQLGNSGSVPQPAIRGVTTTNAGAYENNVVVYIDDVYQVLPAVLNIDLPNVDSVQILKGPQGTLYGRNATGGAILMSTITPGDSWMGNAEVSYARFDDKRVSANIAGPLSDGIGIALAGYWRKTDGWVKQASRTVPGEFDGTAFGLDQKAVRAKLKFDLSDRLKATVGYAYTYVDDPNADNFTPYENETQNPATVPGANLTPNRLGTTAVELLAEISAEQHEGFLDLKFDTDIGTLRSISAYTNTVSSTYFDFDGTYVPSGYSWSEDRYQTYQQTLDFTVTAIDNLDLIIGGQYLKIKQNSKIPNIAVLGPASLGQTYDPSVELPLSGYSTFFESSFWRTKESWAVYADATFQVSDRLSVNVGGRYTEETQDVEVIRLSPFIPGGLAFDSNAYEAANGSQFASKESKFTPRASIRYEITPRTNIYASYSKGYRGGEWATSPPTLGGGLVALFPDWKPTKPETIDAFEVGIKSGGRRLTFNAAAFYYDYKDLQVSFTTVDSRNNPVVILQNAPSAEIYGAEVNIDFEVVKNFNVHAGATWLHARYGDGFIYTGSGVNPNAPAYSQNSDPLKANFANKTVEQDLSGLQMARAPEFAGFLGFDYLIPNGDGGLLFAANAKYSDSYAVTDPSIWGGDPTYNPYDSDPTNDVVDNFELLRGTPYENRSEQQRARQKSYVLLNASVTWTDPTDTYYVRAWGKNLTDQKIAIHYRPGGSGTYIPIAEPLSYGLTVGVKFDGGRTPPPAPVAAPPPPPPPPPPAPPPQVVCNKGPYIVFFEWDQSDITPEASTVLDSAISAYGNCDSVPIMLAGHADRSGSATYNQDLSERRNTSVRGYLTDRGIPDANISSQGFGESQNRVPTADGVREPQNRRVEITYGPDSGM